MKTLQANHATAQIRNCVVAMGERLGDHQVVVALGWESFAAAAGLSADAHVAEPGAVGAVVGVRAAPLAVGTVEHVMALLTAAAQFERIGFVMPAAQRPAQWWRKGPGQRTRFLDPTTKLWQAGWSPLAIERVDVRVGDTRVEVVIGHARMTPRSVSALDDLN